MSSICIPSHASVWAILDPVNASPSDRQPCNTCLSPRPVQQYADVAHLLVISSNVQERTIWNLLSVEMDIVTANLAPSSQVINSRG